MEAVIAILLLCAGGVVIFAAAIGSLFWLRRWYDRPYDRAEIRDADLAALCERLDVLEHEAADVPPLLERVEFLERLFADTAPPRTIVSRSEESGR